MSLSKFNENINYHQNQPDKPTLTSEQLKKLFDQAGLDIKEYLNTVLTAEIDNLISSLNTGISGNTQSINTTNTNLRKQDYLNVPVSTNLIASGDNLNSYTSQGIYTSNTGDISASLSNTPVTESGFKLIVEYLHDSSRIRQTVYANSVYSYTYVRTYSQSGWGNWIKQPHYSIYEKPLTNIDSNSNLNNYIAPGTYVCVNGTIAQSLTNCPFNGAFKLIVDHLHDTSRIRQTIYANNTESATFVRTYTGSWGSWQRITMTSV